MEFKLKEANKWIVSFVLILIGMAVFYYLQNFTGSVIYPRQAFIGGSSFFYGVGDIMNFYYQYAQWFDFFIFLIIFLGLGQFAFGKHFKEGGKALYIGLGIFLALALVIWEARTGILLIEMFGPIVIIFLFILMFFVMYKFLKGSVSRRGIVVISSLYIGFYILFIWLDIGSFIGGYYSSWFYYNIPIDLIPLTTLVFWIIAIPALLIGLIFKGEK